MDSTKRIVLEVLEESGCEFDEDEVIDIIDKLSDEDYDDLLLALETGDGDTIASIVL